ncbi:MAG: metal ABC transporter permease [Erysipelotrichaceae bacterium]|nr:metal ABC transporter permease [Erysipelotrichaceae bacterium]
MSELLMMFSYQFIVRAFVVGLLISLCASLLGVSLVLRGNAMISDGLSHVSFGAFAVATVLNIAPLTLAIPLAIVASIIILQLDERHMIHGDGAIALLSSSALAIGVMVISITKGVNTDINNYLFGSILSLSNTDMIISIVLSIMVLILFFYSYHRIFALTFDQDFARSTGVKVDLYNMIIAILCSVTIVLGMRMMGALLISSLTIFPCLSSMRIARTFRLVVLWAAIIAVVCFIIGLSISYLYATPTGASIVIVHLVVFLILSVVQMVKA